MVPVTSGEPSVILETSAGPTVVPVAAAGPSVTSTGPTLPDYSKWTVVRLKAELKSRGCVVGGNKLVLIARLCAAIAPVEEAMAPNAETIMDAIASASESTTEGPSDAELTALTETSAIEEEEEATVEPGTVELAEETAAKFGAAGAALAMAEAGGEVLTMCADVPVAKEAEKETFFRASTVVDADGRIKLEPLDGLEYADLWQWKTGTSGQLWQSLYGWMSGTCGLVLYLQLQMLVKSSAVWFHAHHWAIGTDPTPRLLQKDGSFAPLPAGRRACQLPEFSLSLLLSLLQASESCETLFAEEYVTIDAMLPTEIAGEMKARPAKAYKAAIKKYTKHAMTYQMLPSSLARMTEDSGPVFLRAVISVFFPDVAIQAGVQAVVEPGSEADEYHAALQDITDPELIMHYLATASSPLETQLCHERFLEMAIEANAVTQYKAVIAERQ